MCSEGGLNFCYFTLTFGHFYTQKWKFSLKTFNKVVDMAYIFTKIQLKKFWARAETKTGICWGRIKAKVFDKFQTLWIFNMFTCSNSIPSFVLATCIMGLNMNMWTCWRSKVFEIRQMGKVVQHCENIWNSLPY